mgnify:CR=1 FL=1
MDQDPQSPQSGTHPGVVTTQATQAQPAEVPAVTMYTTTWCSDCVAAKRYLDAKGVTYHEVDIEQDDAAMQLVMALNSGKRSVPTLVSGDVAASLSGFSIQKARDFLTAAGLAS